ncbi:MAG TPA: hypothetical protein VMB21_15170 [Candidatus Limnocylindria bacterium]|nr:hypothetical protein [Candidatus Limnocylindria bacterium]
MVLLIGLPGAILWRGSKKWRFRCAGCGTLFYAHTPVSKVSWLLVWLLLAFVFVWDLTVLLFELINPG